MNRARCVTLFSPAWPPTAAPNGIVTYTGYMKRALESGGVRTIVAVPDDGEDSADVFHAMKRPGLLRRAGAKLGLGGNGDAAGARLAGAVRGLVGRERVDVVEMEESFGWCGDVARDCGAPVVGRLHGPWFLNGPNVGAAQDEGFRLRVDREREGILRCAGVTSPSRDVLERTRAYYGVELSGAEVIPYPIEPFPEAARWRPDGHEPGLILFIGRFDRHKGGDVILDAFGLVASRSSAARLLFVGPDRGLADGKGGRAMMADYLQRLPASARERVEWTGFQPADRLPALRARAAVTVVCSRYETFGYTVLEGMAGGCPMVVTRAGGPSELVEHERSALMCEPGDPQGLALQIERMLGDANLARRLGEEGFRDACTRYEPAAIAERTLGFYGKVLRT
ncbi:MAG: glycosyltransferase family 4 protein [Phycisphaerales bacterium]